MREEPDVMVHYRNSSTEEAETGGLLGLWDSQPSLLGQIQANERLCPQNQAG